MNRRSFLTLLASVPLLGRLAPRPDPFAASLAAWVKTGHGTIFFEEGGYLVPPTLAAEICHAWTAQRDMNWLI